MSRSPFFFVVVVGFRTDLRYVVDAVSPLDLVRSRTLLFSCPFYAQLPGEGDAFDVRGESGVFSRRYVSERPEPQPVGGRNEHLHARVRI